VPADFKPHGLRLLVLVSATASPLALAAASSLLSGSVPAAVGGGAWTQVSGWVILDESM